MASSSSLQLQVILQAIDKATAPMRRIKGASGDAARALKDARDKLKALNQQQKAVGEFREVRAGLAKTSADLQAAQTRVKELAQQFGQAGPPTKAMARDLNTARKEAAGLSEQFKRQQQQTQRLRDKLSAAGISAGNLGNHERRLRGDIESTSASIKAQTEVLRRQGEQMRRVTQLKAAHTKAMIRAGMVAGAGAAGIATGRALSRPLVSSMQAFGDQESAAMQLRAAVMVADGSVPSELTEISKLVQSLGDRLPGTTADFYEMMTVLKREGITNKAILGGLGEAAAYLGVQLQLPVDQAAKFAAQMQDATRATEGEMMGLMDVIQRTFYLGVDSTQMLAGFSKLSGSLSTLRKTGVDAANTLAPLLVMMNQSGMNDGGSAGNAIRKVIDAGLNAKKLGKTNALLDSGKAGFKLNFVKNGQFAGLDNAFEQLKKIQSIQDIMVRKSVLRELFGDDAETHQVLGVMMDKGIDGYREVVAKMQAQADLRKRVDEQLGTLKNVLEAAQGAGINVLAAIGSTVAPELKQLVNWLGDVASKTRAWIEANPQLVATLVKVVAVVAGLYAILGAVALAIASVVAPMLVMRFGFAYLSAVLGPLAGTVLRLLASGLGIVAKAVLFLGRALLMNPIGLAITAIAVAAYLIYQYWGPIRDFFIGLWDGVTARFAAFWQYLGGSVPAALATVSAAILNWSPLGLLYTAFAGAMRWLGFDLPAKFTEFGAQIMQGLANGITSALGGVKDAITGAAEAALGWFKEKLGIRSPSRVFMLAGNEISNGAAEGITEQQRRVRQAALGMAAAAASALPLVAGAGAGPGGVLFDRRPPISAAASAGRSVSIGGDTIQITIQAAPGMDAQALARAVSAELDRRQSAKRAVMMSALSDID